MRGVPVKATKSAFGSAARMFIASWSYCDLCASSTMTMTSGRALSTSAVWNLWISVKT